MNLLQERVLYPEFSGPSHELVAEMQRFTVRNIILRHSFSTTQRKRVTIEHNEVSMRPVPSCTVAPENLSFVLYSTEEVLLTKKKFLCGNRT